MGKGWVQSSAIAEKYLWMVTIKTRRGEGPGFALLSETLGGTAWQGCISFALHQQGRSPEPAFALPVCDLPKMHLSGWVQSCTFWGLLTCVCHLLLSPDLWQPGPCTISKAASQKHTAGLTYVNFSHKITHNQQTIHFKESF